MVMPAQKRADQPVTWRSLVEFGEQFARGPLADLLTTRTSMTGALRARCRGDFRLRVVAENAADLGVYQHGELAGNHGRVREVLMGCGDAPWLFAQTLIPDQTLAACPWLAELGERPLGDVLFARDDVERGDFLYARLGVQAPLSVSIRKVLTLGDAGALWARRSYFYVGGQPLLVNEVFLPGLATG